MAKSKPFLTHGFDRELDLLVQNLFHEPTPDILYHYTKWDGAEGILTSKQIWATSHDCTNDSGEISSADETIIAVARAIRDRFAPPAQQMLDNLVNNYSRLKVTKITPVFLSCFSKARDKNSLWQKSYADYGKGLCIGIQILQGEKLPKGGFGKALLPVDYSEMSWKKRIERGFSEVCSRLNEVTAQSPKLSEEAEKMALVVLYRIAAYAAVTAKTSEWADEEEWRLVILPEKGFRDTHRARYIDGKCIKYISIDARLERRPLSIDEILIGPKQNEKEARSQLEDLLKYAGYPNEFAKSPKITMSEVSLKSP